MGIQVPTYYKAIHADQTELLNPLGGQVPFKLFGNPAWGNQMVISRSEDPHITFNSTTANKQAVLFFNSSGNDFRITMNGNTYKINVTQI